MAFKFKSGSWFKKPRFTENEVKAIARKILRRIKKRADSGTGVSGNGRIVNWPDLSGITQEQYARGVRVGRRVIKTSQVQSRLRLSGEMFRDFSIKSVRRDQFKLGFGDKKNEDKAKGHHAGIPKASGGVVKRPFVNLSMIRFEGKQSDEKLILRELKKIIFRKE